MIRAVHIDFGLYIAIAVCSAFVAMFSSDDAAKYLNPALLWWIKNIFIVLGAGFLSAKMFRSTQFGDDKQKQTETQQWRINDKKSQPGPVP